METLKKEWLAPTLPTPTPPHSPLQTAANGRDSTPQSHGTSMYPKARLFYTSNISKINSWGTTEGSFSWGEKHKEVQSWSEVCEQNKCYILKSIELNQCYLHKYRGIALWMWCCMYYINLKVFLCFELQGIFAQMLNIVRPSHIVTEHLSTWAGLLGFRFLIYKLVTKLDQWFLNY